MKKRILSISLICLLMSVLTLGTTYALLIHEDKVINYFTVGSTAIVIEEEFTPPPKLEPDISFVKKPEVVNTGNLPCYVRMRVDISNSDVIDYVTLKYLESDTVNTENWEYNTQDGYYYYKEVLAANSRTEPIFTSVSISKYKPDGETELTVADLEEFDISIYAESIQIEDDSISYMEAWSLWEGSGIE